MVTVNRPSFVYLVAYEDHDGHLVMYPAEEPMQICPDRPTRLPARGQHFRLNESTGLENPYVIASVQPLQTPTVAVAQLVGEVQPSPAVLSDAPARGTSTKPPLMPVPTTMPTIDCPKPAGITLWEPSSGALLAPGIGVVHVPFRHEPKVR
jgi:hypothetical protein